MNQIARTSRRLAGILAISLCVGSAAPLARADDSGIKADVKHAAHTVGDAARQVGQDVKHAAKKVPPTAKKVGHTAAHAAKSAGHAIAQGARETGAEIKEATHKGVSKVKGGKETKDGS